MRVLQSSENYLETVLMLEKRKGQVRAIDIANELGFSKASVSVALKQLRENGYLQVDEHSLIHLLPKGAEIAERMYERHILLTECFRHFGVSEEVAAQDACKVEHVISDETFQAIKSFMLKNFN